MLESANPPHGLGVPPPPPPPRSRRVDVVWTENTAKATRMRGRPQSKPLTRCTPPSAPHPPRPPRDAPPRPPAGRPPRRQPLPLRAPRPRALPPGPAARRPPGPGLPGPRPGPRRGPQRCAVPRRAGRAGGAGAADLHPGPPRHGQDRRARRDHPAGGRGRAARALRGPLQRRGGQPRGARGGPRAAVRAPGQPRAHLRGGHAVLPGVPRRRGAAGGAAGVGRAVPGAPPARARRAGGGGPAGVRCLPRPLPNLSPTDWGGGGG